MSEPKNKQLYEQVKAEADVKYKKPSAYKSGWIVKEYKKRGGEYLGSKTKKGLTRWFKEEWEDIGGKDYPVYRPTKRISKNTPLTASEIDPKQAKEQIARKQVIKGNKNLPKFEKKIGGYSIMDDDKFFYPVRYDAGAYPPKDPDDVYAEISYGGSLIPTDGFNERWAAPHSSRFLPMYM